MTKMCTSKELCANPDGPELPLEEFYIRRNRKNGNARLSKCKMCEKEKGKIDRENNKEYYIEYRKNNIHYDSDYYKKRYIKDRDKILERCKKYRENNKGKISAASRRYTLSKIQRTPAWADLKAIEDVYIDCEELNLAAKTAGCTEIFVVDHIIPLRGKLVSGLHIETNLQIITAAQNAEKSNKFDPKLGV